MEALRRSVRKPSGTAARRPVKKGRPSKTVARKPVSPKRAKTANRKKPARVATRRR
jgi:hypothetical protein